MRHIEKGTGQLRLDQAGNRFLCVETLIFSAVYAVIFQSWVVFGVIFLGLSLLIKAVRGELYVVCALSFMWAFIFISMGYGVGGWGWAIASGAVVFIIGVARHMSDLCWSRDKVEDMEWTWNRQNLN